jgi:GAF domain-containing protein
LTFLFFQHEKRLLRERLRGLTGQAEADLHRDLSRLLESICEPIQASYAILLVRQDELYEQAAAYHWRQAELNLPAAILAADDFKQLQPDELPEPVAKAALLIPIYLGDQQIGALLLGSAEHGLAYSPVELDGLQEFGDYLGGWLGHFILPRNEQAEQLKQEFQPEPELFSSSPAKISTRTVELGLRNLHDYAKLAELPLAEIDLAHQRSGSNPSHIETGKAVQRLLCEAVEQLRPPGEEEKHINRAPRRDWYPYIILRDAYVDRLPNRQIMDRLYISEGTFLRIRRSGIRSLTRLLIEMKS